MRASNLMGRTLREEPQLNRKDATLLARAGFLRAFEGGVILLPLGVRVYQRILSNLDEGGNEMLIRMGRVSGSALGGVIKTLQGDIQSYRDLPIHARLLGEQVLPHSLDGKGWTTACEQILLAGGSPQDVESLRLKEIEKWETLLEFDSQELVCVTDGPEDLIWSAMEGEGWFTYLRCKQCGQRQTQSRGLFRRLPPPEDSNGDLLTVATPGCDTIQKLADYLQVPKAQTLKAVMLADENDLLIFVVIQGNYEVSMEKLSAYLGGGTLRPATEHEITSTGAVAGYASPIGLQVAASNHSGGIRVIADESVVEGAGYVAGANKVGFHSMHVSSPRDFLVSEFADIAHAEAEYACTACGGELEQVQAFPVASYRALEASFTYTSETGRERDGSAAVFTWFPVEMMLAICQRHHGPRGLVWPRNIAPYRIHLLDLKQPDQAEWLYRRIQSEGLSVLWDDRKLSPGVKFKDADLIGCPIQLTVSCRSLEKGGVEILRRKVGEPVILPMEDAVAYLSTVKE